MEKVASILLQATEKHDVYIVAHFVYPPRSSCVSFENTNYCTRYMKNHVLETARQYYTSLEIAN